MRLDQDTLDDMTEAAAAELLDNTVSHMELWKAARDHESKRRDHGLAPAGDLGVNLLPFIANIFQMIWEWLQTHQNEIAIPVLVSIISDIFNNRSKPSDKSDHPVALPSPLTDEERSILIDKMAELLLEEWKKRQ